VAPTPTRGALADKKAQIGGIAVIADLVAVEMINNETTWWLLRVEARLRRFQLAASART